MHPSGDRSEFSAVTGWAACCHRPAADFADWVHNEGTEDVFARGVVCAPFLANANDRACQTLGSGACAMAVSVSCVTEAALTELAGLLMSSSSFEHLMQSVADLSGRAVPAAVTCGITLSECGHVITVASSDSLAKLLDEQQYELDAGPCLQALRTGTVVLADDLSVETRWTGYPALALAHGVRSVLSSPLLAGDRPIGALNLYATKAGAFDADAQSAAAQLAALAAATATAALLHFDQASLTDHLRTALSSRSVIDQAMGIIIGMQRCPPETAFDVLRTASQNRNVPLREVAADLVATTTSCSASTNVKRR